MRLYRNGYVVRITHDMFSDYKEYLIELGRYYALGYVDLSEHEVKLIVNPVAQALMNSGHVVLKSPDMTEVRRILPCPPRISIYAGSTVSDVAWSTLNASSGKVFIYQVRDYVSEDIWDLLAATMDSGELVYPMNGYDMRIPVTQVIIIADEVPMHVAARAAVVLQVS